MQYINASIRDMDLMQKGRLGSTKKTLNRFARPVSHRVTADARAIRLFGLGFALQIGQSYLRQTDTGSTLGEFRAFIYIRAAKHDLDSYGS